MRATAIACVVLAGGSLAFGATIRDDTTSGLIREPTTWDGTVEVVGDVTVDNGFTLTIEPGTRVVFAYRCRLIVDGTLVARGTEADSIVFTIADTAGFGTGTHLAWRGIRFDHVDTANNTSIFEYCRFEYGRAEGSSPHRYGGAVFARGGSRVAISHCEFRHDSAAYGGAVYVDSAAVSIAECRFIGNTAYVGGAVYIYGCDPMVERCLFKNNRGDFGGGLYCLESSPDVFSCVFDGNEARTHGGGMFSNTRSWPQVYGCTFVNNSALVGGGHYTLLETGNTIDIPEIGCSIFWNNGDELGGDDITVARCCVKGGASGTANIDADPLLRDTAAGDYGLRIGSPCIHAGGNPPIGSHDFVGNNRIFDDSMDIGAIEARCEVFNGRYYWHEQWDADTVLVHAKAYVHTGYVLRVSPGTVVMFDSGGVKVRGSLIAQGTKDDSIVFVLPDMTYGFDGISLDTIPLSFFGELPAFAYCRFQGPGPLGRTAGIQVNNCEAPVAISNSVFTGILSNSTRPLTVYGSNVSLSDCVFRANKSLSSRGGAAMFSGCTSGVDIVRCTFINNEAAGGSPMGGAVAFLANTDAGLSECVFEHNAAGLFGGALCVGNAFGSDSSSVKLDRCILTNSSAGCGGAVFLSQGTTLAATNSLFSANTPNGLSPSWAATAIGSWGGTANLANCTFAGNASTAPAVAGWQGTGVTAINSIFWNGGNELAVYDTSTKTVTYSCVQGGDSGTANIDQYPDFVDTLLGDYTLGGNSPCTNSGAADTAGIGIGSFDLAGNPRISGGIVDMGAFEREPAVGSICAPGTPVRLRRDMSQWQVLDLRGRVLGTISGPSTTAARKLSAHGVFLLKGSAPDGSPASPRVIRVP